MPGLAHDQRRVVLVLEVVIGVAGLRTEHQVGIAQRLHVAGAQRPLQFRRVLERAATEVGRVDRAVALVTRVDGAHGGVDPQLAAELRLAFDFHALDQRAGGIGQHDHAFRIDRR
ncbi:hypothetical protein D3C81_1617230 [compost metagenome]